jgi:hypothetical protein
MPALVAHALCVPRRHSCRRLAFRLRLWRGPPGLLSRDSSRLFGRVIPRAVEESDFHSADPRSPGACSSPFAINSPQAHAWGCSRILRAFNPMRQLGAYKRNRGMCCLLVTPIRLTSFPAPSITSRIHFTSHPHFIPYVLGKEFDALCHRRAESTKSSFLDKLQRVCVR